MQKRKLRNDQIQLKPTKMRVKKEKNDSQRIKKQRQRLERNDVLHLTSTMVRVENEKSNSGQKWNQK